jgi:hypothetical protein
MGLACAAAPTGDAAQSRKANEGFFATRKEADSYRLCARRSRNISLRQSVKLLEMIGLFVSRF